MISLRYVVPGVVRRYTPEAILFAVMARRGDGNLGEQDPGAYVLEYSRRLASRNVDVAGKHILEGGSGRFARAALPLLSAGARQVTLVDLYAEPLTEPKHADVLTRDCAQLGLDAADARARIEVIRGDFLQTAPRKQSIDLAISNAVLEHVWDPQAILARCGDWLKPGGATCHFVDMRDHNLQFRYPYEMLTFSEQTWRTWLDLPRGFLLNRWRLPDYLNAMHDAGFVDVSYDVVHADPPGLRAIWPRLAPPYRAMTPEALAVLEIYLYGWKPLEVASARG